MRQKRRKSRNYAAFWTPKLKIVAVNFRFRNDALTKKKEENLDKRPKNLEKKDHILAQKIKDADNKMAELEEVKARQLAELEKISGMTKEEAKQTLITDIESQARHEAAIMVKEIEQR